VKVVIIGGGIMGCATAQALARSAVEVIVLESAVPGGEASGAAAGILGGQAELHGRERDVARFMDAREAWPRWAEELGEATGVDVGYRRSGVLRLAKNEVEREEIEKEVAWQSARGLLATLLGGEDARRIEPHVAADAIGAAHFPNDAQVDPRCVLRAILATLAREPRVRVRPGTTASALIVSGGRCVGVKVDGGDIFADATVIAGGSWSSLLAGFPESWPRIRPVRGQMIELAEQPAVLSTIVFGAEGYVVPRGNGRVLCGSTTEHVGFQRGVTAAGVAAILSNALGCVPSLAHAQVIATWSNFRPQVDGVQPLIGASPLEGLFLATGHYRNGILLAKTTADTVSQAILES
jgi:glycine oxidase